MTLVPVRLRCVLESDFRYGETHHWATFSGRYPNLLSRIESWCDFDAVCFVSKTGNQILFMYKLTTVPSDTGVEKVVIRSTRFRLLGKSSWSPEMLAVYAASVGIEIINITRFERYWRHRGE